jgi:hypothetical protein
MYKNEERLNEHKSSNQHVVAGKLTVSGIKTSLIPLKDNYLFLTEETAC